MKEIDHDEITDVGWTKIASAEKTEKVVGVTTIGNMIVCATSTGLYCLKHIPRNKE